MTDSPERRAPGIVAELVDAISRMGRETEHSVILHLKGREFLMQVRILPIPQTKNMNYAILYQET